MEKETKCRFQEVLAHIGYAFGEKPEAVGRALQQLGTFDEVIMVMLSAEEMGITLDKALQQFDDKSSPYHCTAIDIRNQLWTRGMFYVH